MSPGRVAIGLTLVAIGGVALLSALDVLDASETFGDWWPSVIVILGATHAMVRRRLVGGPLVITVAGAVLLGVTTGAFGSDAWSFVWPAALIVAGIWVVVEWGRGREGRVRDLETVDGLAVLSATRIATTSNRFRRGSLTSVLGSVTLDLTRAMPAPDAVVSATAVLGSVDVVVPQGWRVEVRGVPLLGTWDDTTDRSAIDADGPTLVVHGFVVVGGIEIKHPRRWG